MGSTPILHTIPKEIIAERVTSLQPADFMNLVTMVRQRPSILQGNLKSEIEFYQVL